MLNNIDHTSFMHVFSATNTNFPSSANDDRIVLPKKPFCKTPSNAICTSGDENFVVCGMQRTGCFLIWWCNDLWWNADTTTRGYRSDRAHGIRVDQALLPANGDWVPVLVISRFPEFNLVAFCIHDVQELSVVVGRNGVE